MGNAGMKGYVSIPCKTLKSERTRTDLLRAAEAVFARDGFEASRIEDIAGEAGRSRGAFYANFASKTEVFLALRGLVALRHSREIRERVQNVSGEDARYAAVIRYLLEQISDPRTQLLQIEFKLFALRHPEMLPELSTKHLDASTSSNREELADLFPEKNESVVESQRMTLTIEAVLEGFALNAQFNTKIMDGAQLERIVPKILGTIFASSRHVTDLQPTD